MLLAALATCVDATDAGTATYRSAVYGFEFSYPDSLDIREYTPTIIALGRGDEEAFAAVAEIVLEASDDVEFEALAIERARTSCAADGPGRSLACTEVLDSRPFTTTAGGTGIVFRLRHVMTVPGEGTLLEESSRGPFHALDVSDSVAEETGVLFIRPPTVLDPDRVDQGLIEEVAVSVVI